MGGDAPLDGRARPELHELKIADAVNIADLRDGRSATNVDCACTGTTLRDFVRCTTLERLPDDVVARYDDESALE